LGFWVVTLVELLVGFLGNGGTCCLHLRGKRHYMWVHWGKKKEYDVNFESKLLYWRKEFFLQNN